MSRARIARLGGAAAAFATLAALAACNALVESPDAFTLRPPISACDGGDCADVVDGDAGVGPDLAAGWPMFGANAAHTSRVAATGSRLASTKAYWSVKVGAAPSAGPAVDGDGTAYFTTVGGNLYAVRRDGTTWSQALGGATRCTPALAADGTVYATASGVGLVAYSRDGSTKRWTVPVGGGSHPVIGKDGSIYVIDDAGVHAVSPAGTESWTYPIGTSAGARHEAVAVDDEGVIYAVREGVHAIDPTGKRVWHEPAYGDALSPPPVAFGGLLFIGSGNDVVALATTNHEKAWSTGVGGTGGGRLRASPAVAGNGFLYLVADGTLFFAGTSDGLFDPASPTIDIAQPFTPAVDGTSIAYGATAAGGEFVTAARFSGTAEQGGTWTLGAEPVGFAIGKDGAVYIATTNEVVALPP